MDNFLASSEVDTSVLAPQIFAGDTPPVVTLPGMLLAGQNLVAGTVLMRDPSTGQFTQWVVGTAPAVAVLCLDVNASGGMTNCEVYVAGCFNTNWLTWPTPMTNAQQLGAFDGSKLAHRALYWSAPATTA